MKLKIVNRSDFEAGLFFAASGIGVVVLSSGYIVGSVSSMGPGYFPIMLGLTLTVIGAILLGRSLFLSGSDGDVPPIEWRSAAIILASVALFGVLLRTAGLLLAIPALVLLASLAADAARLKLTLLLALALALFCYLIFVAALGLPLPVLPTAIRWT